MDNKRIPPSTNFLSNYDFYPGASCNCGGNLPPEPEPDCTTYFVDDYSIDEFESTSH